MNRQISIYLLLAFVGLTGCRQDSTPISQVSGSVRCNGQAITEGEVHFASEDGFGVSAPIQADGAYHLRSHHGNGIPHGEYKVIVTPPAAIVNETFSAQQSSTKNVRSEIPFKYQKFDTSGLKFTIGSGSQAFDLNLEG